MLRSGRPGQHDILDEGLHDALDRRDQDGGDEPPRNVGYHRRLDAQYSIDMYEYIVSGPGSRSTRPGRIYVPTSEEARRPGSWISDETHIQVCVRNPRNILAVWHVREDGRYGVENVICFTIGMRTALLLALRCPLVSGWRRNPLACASG